MKAVLIVILIVGAAACSSGRVRCDGRLSAINPPAPLAAPAEASGAQTGKNSP